MRLGPFGTTGLTVSQLGLGCARIGGVFKNDPGSFVQLLQRARELGINFFDTADMYSQGESEVLLGRAFRGQRDRVIIASKVGYALPAQRKLVARVKPLVRPLIRLLRIKREHLPTAVRGALAQDFSPRYIESATEASLRRLRTDYLDLLQLHSPPAEVVARGEWAEALTGLQRAGKIRHYGISCDTLEAAEAALRFEGLSALQLVVNLLDQRFAQVIVPRAKERGVAVIARECLANGVLVKTAAELDLNQYWPAPEQAALQAQRLDAYRQQAEERNVPLSRLALEYVTGLEGVSVALVGASKTDQLTRTMHDFGIDP